MGFTIPLQSKAFLKSLQECQCHLSPSIIMNKYKAPIVNRAIYLQYFLWSTLVTDSDSKKKKKSGGEANYKNTHIHTRTHVRTLFRSKLQVYQEVNSGGIKDCTLYTLLCATVCFHGFYSTYLVVQGQGLPVIGHQCNHNQRLSCFLTQLKT